MKKFTVDYIFNVGRKITVMATQIEKSEFRLTDSSYLSGIPIEKSLSMPRKLKKDGSPDYDTFVFTLKYKNDEKKINLGDLVELEEER